jgi:hypothetical protein
LISFWEEKCGRGESRSVTIHSLQLLEKPCAHLKALYIITTKGMLPKYQQSSR